MARRLANEDIVSSPRRAAARAHLRAMGLDERDWSRLLVGIATTFPESYVEAAARRRGGDTG